MSVHRFWVAAFLVALILAGSLIPVDSEVASALANSASDKSRACGPAWESVATPRLPGSMTLFGVDARTKKDVWAVGAKSALSGSITLVEHWDGTEWTVEPSPSPVSDESVLFGVTAIADDDVWAVGRAGIPFAERVRPLIEHFNGRNWKIVPAPPLKGETDLSAVMGFAKDDVWAAGFNSTPKSARHALVLHWNGSKWRVVKLPPDRGYNNYLFALGGTGSKDVWTVGANFHNEGEPSTIHWDGKHWERVPFETKVWSDNLLSLAAVEPTDVWAGGTAGLYQNDKPLLTHWNGKSWSKERFPVLGRGHSGEGDGPINEIDGLALSSADDVWGVGQFMSWGRRAKAGPLTAFAGHYDGRSWQAWPLTPDVTPHQLTEVRSGAAWWVGETNDSSNYQAFVQRICPMVLRSSGYVRANVSVNVGETVAWKVARDVSATVSVQDTMGLIDSGPLRGDGSYTQALSASGTYELLMPSRHSRKVAATVGVRPMIELLSTASANQFLVTWGTAAAPSGDVYDVQIKQPGTEGFVPWKSGVTQGSAEFAASAGAGTYRFRARLRSTDYAETMPFSPPAQVLVPSS